MSDNTCNLLRVLMVCTSIVLIICVICGCTMYHKHMLIKYNYEEAWDPGARQTLIKKVRGVE
jgi:hypothetical protein